MCMSEYVFVEPLGPLIIHMNVLLVRLRSSGLTPQIIKRDMPTKVHSDTKEKIQRINIPMESSSVKFIIIIQIN